MNNLVVLIIILAAAVFIYAVIVLPRFRPLRNAFYKPKGAYTVDDVYNTNKVDREKELNRILDKIGRSGVESLSRSEKEFLDKNAKK